MMGESFLPEVRSGAPGAFHYRLQLSTIIMNYSLQSVAHSFEARNWQDPAQSAASIYLAGVLK